MSEHFECFSPLRQPPGGLVQQTLVGKERLGGILSRQRTIQPSMNMMTMILIIVKMIIMVMKMTMNI